MPIQLAKFGDVVSVSISNDGKNITFMRHLTASGENEFWRVNADATGLHKLESDPKATNPKVVGDQSFKYSPDGKWLVTYGTNGIRLYDANEHSYTIPGLHQDNAGDHKTQIAPAWNQDGKSFLLVSAENTATNQSVTAFKVLRIWVEDQHIEEVGSFTGFTRSIQFSPDQKFMFYSADEYIVPNELHLVNLDEKKDIIFGKEDNLSIDQWSPNSRDFLFNVGNSTYVGNVCQNIQRRNKFPRFYAPQSLIWLGDTTLLNIKPRDQLTGKDSYLSFIDLTGNYKSHDTVLALDKGYDFAIVSP